MGYRWTAVALKHPAIAGEKVYVFDQRAEDPDWIEGALTYVGGDLGRDLVVKIEGDRLVEAELLPELFPPLSA